MNKQCLFNIDNHNYKKIPFGTAIRRGNKCIALYGFIDCKNCSFFKPVKEWEFDIAGFPIKKPEKKNV